MYTECGMMRPDLNGIYLTHRAYVVVDNSRLGFRHTSSQGSTFQASTMQVFGTY
jgi:hypothetical protein